MPEYEDIPGEETPLGWGHFGFVKKVRRKSDRQVVACKCILFPDYDADVRATVEQDVQREFHILRRLDHPNVVRFLDIAWFQERAELYMEFCDRRTLADVIQTNRRLKIEAPENYVWDILLQLVSALAYCHYGIRIDTEGDGYFEADYSGWDLVIHRDIKPGNVLLSSSAESPGVVVKLADFGLGVTLQEEGEPGSYVGTEQYMAPEIKRLNGASNVWTKKCDVFSFGCTVYDLCMSRPPFDYHMEDESETFEPVANRYSERLQRCVAACLSFMPEDRADIREIFRLAKQLDDVDGGTIVQAQGADVARPKVPTTEQPVESSEERPPQPTLKMYRLGSTEFQSATPLDDIAGRDETLFQQLLENGCVSQNSIWTMGRTPRPPMFNLAKALDWAASAGHEIAVRVLLKKGASASAALQKPAAGGHAAIVRLLLEKGADVAMTDSEGQTALHRAAGGGHVATLRVLLHEKRANAVPKDRSGLTALHWAVQNGHEAAARLLLARGFDIEERDNAKQTPLMVAAHYGHNAAVGLLLDRGADVAAVDAKGQTALHIAAEAEREAVLRLLLEKGADIEATDSNTRTALHVAARDNLEAMLLLLLGKGAVVAARDEHGWTALHVAADGGHEAIGRLLLKNGADFWARTNDGETVLYLAAANGHEPVVRQVLMGGADVKAAGPKGRTALHVAARRGHEAIVRLLLKEEIDIEQGDHKGRTALLLAVWGRTAAIVRLLLRHEANVSARGVNGSTALHQAAIMGEEAIVSLLLKRGAKLGARDDHGRTPLHWAAYGLQEAIVELLLNNGAKEDRVDNYGEPVLPDEEIRHPCMITNREGEPALWRPTTRGSTGKEYSSRSRRGNALMGV